LKAHLKETNLLTVKRTLPEKPISTKIKKEILIRFLLKLILKLQPKETLTIQNVKPEPIKLIKKLVCAS